MSRGTPHWSARLRDIGACSEAIEWAATQPSLTAAWQACERGEWMLWLAGRLTGPPRSASRKRLVLAACACARLVLPHVTPGDDRPRCAIEVAERWARGERGVTLDDVHSAAAAASVAAFAFVTPAAVTAAAAASSSYYAPYAAYRVEGMRQCADLVRQHYSRPPRLPQRAVQHTTRCISGEADIDQVATLRSELEALRAAHRQQGDDLAQAQAGLGKAVSLLRDWLDSAVEDDGPDSRGCALFGCIFGNGRPHRHWCPVPDTERFLDRADGKAALEARKQVLDEWQATKQLLADADWYQHVLDFHVRFGQLIQALPAVPTSGAVDLRLALCGEEWREFEEAMRAGNLPAIADAIADLTYVLLGTGVSYGIDIRPVWRAVHAANMAKVGGAVRGDGKILKPDGWQPPDIAGVLAAQQPLESAT